MKNSLLILTCCLITLCIGGCVTTQPQNDIIDNRNTLTLGSVQRNIKKGVSQTEVITTLGSPNIVTNDGGKETWVYDKISTLATASEIKGGVVGAGFGGAAIGVAGISGSQSNSSTSQKTLTVIIKFDTSNVVEEVLYHTSKY